MPYQKKKYKLKPLAYFMIGLAAVVLILIAVLIFKLASSPADTEPEPDDVSSVSASQTVSYPSSSQSSAVSSESSDNSSNDSSDDNSSGTSSETNSNSVNSSEAQSSNTEISSSETSSETNSNNLLEQVMSGPYGIPLWNLVLLNPDAENKIDNELTFEKTKFDSQYVDSRAGEMYQEMYNAAKADGITLYLRSGYRSIATQKTNYQNALNRYISAGNSEKEAARLTNMYYTVPGHSEHHSGLAFDIITPEYHNNIYSLDERFAATDAYAWLTNNSEKYGFILRYPKNKESVTNISFEPWHYRYVGVNHAKAINKLGVCLEEYIETIKGEFALTCAETDVETIESELASFANEYADRF